MSVSTTTARRSWRRSGARALAGLAATALVSAGLAVATTTPAAAAPAPERGNGTLSVSSATVQAGGLLTVNGSGFDQRPDGGFIAFKLNDGAIPFPTDQPDGDTDATGTVYVDDPALVPDADGSFELQLRVPADLADSATPQDYWVRFLGGADGGSATSKYAFFTVGAPATTPTASVTAATTSGSGSVSLSIAGSGYTAGSTVSLQYAGNPVSWSGNVAALAVGADGTFTGTASLAAGTALAGEHTISVVGSADPATDATFTTSPAVSITGNPSPGATVAVTAVNLPASSSVTAFGATANWLSAPVAADATGRATVAAVTVPANATVGAAITLTYSTTGGPVVFATGRVVAPDDSAFNADRFTITSQVLPNGLYQTAYNPKTDTLFATTAVGRPPVTDSKLLKIDGTSLQVQQQVSAAVADPSTGGLYAVYGIGVNNKRGQVWITNTRQNTVAVYAQSDLSLLRQFPDGTTEHSRDVIVDEKAQKAYVSSASKNYIDVFDAKTLTWVERITLGTTSSPFNVVMSLDLDQKTGMLYTTSLSSPTAAAIDTRHGNAVQYYNLGSNVRSASGVAFDSKQNRLWVASQVTNNVVALDLATGAVVADIPAGAGSLNASYDPLKNLVYVSNRTGGTITVMSAKTLQRVANLPAGVNPNHVAHGKPGVTYAVNKAGLDAGGNPTNVVQRITVKSRPASVDRPTVSGMLEVGSELTATTGVWLNADAATFSYRWLRNGAVITGATASTYTLTARDAGKAVQVKVTAKVNGYSASATSAEVEVPR